MARDSLRGCTVVVTRPAAQAQALCGLIEAAGARALPVPAIRIEPTEHKSQAMGLLEKADSFDAVIFTSPNAVDGAARVAPGLLGRLPRSRVFAVGPGTRDALARQGANASAPPAGEAGSEGLLRLASFAPGNMAGRRVLIVRGEGGRELMREELTARGAAVEFAEVYRRVVPESGRALLENVWKDGRPDIIVVTSRQGLEHVLLMTDARHQDALRATPLVVISRRVAEHASGLGFQRVTVASAAGDMGLMDAIFRSRETRS